MRILSLIAAFTIISWTTFADDCNQMTAVRNHFHAARSATKLQYFLKFTKKIDCDQAYPYYASAIMKQAEYVSSPLKKLKYFKQGKAMLEKHITEHPNDLEARYVRILVQKNVPSILGYSNNIPSDTRFIKSRIANSGLSVSYKKTILKYIKS